MTEKAWKFIKTGIIDNIDISILAAECNSLLRQETQKSVKNAIALSRKFVKYSLPFKGEMLQTAYRAQGWALHVGGQYKKAEKNYLQARLLSNKDPLTRARIDRILIDIYMYQGNFKEAQKRSRQALNTFKKIKAYEDAAKTLINYGNLYHRQDRHQEALKQYKKVETFFKSKSNNLILALCYYNQANTLVQLIDFKKAYPLYKKAENIFEQLNFYLYANEARYGLSWLMMLQGDFHKSLDSLSKCMKIYQKASQPKGVMLCNLDMAEAYLSLNLISDSIRSSTIAEKQARKLKLNYEAAKASFFLAKATYATGKESKAKKILIRAREGFEKEKNYGFLAAVQLMSILMNSKSKNKTKELQLARNNFSKSQMPLWEAICDLQIGTSGIESKSSFDRLRKNPAVKTVPCLYAHWQTILGDSYADANKLTLAQKHWINAANMLDSVRMKLPPVELRNSFFENRSDPYLKIIETTAKDNPEKAALWAERFKTAGLWASIKFDSATHKVRHKAENSLAQLANQVMNLSYQIDDRSGKRSIVYNQNHRLYKSLQKQVRQNFIEIDIFYQNTSNYKEPIIEMYKRISQNMPVIQFHQNVNDLFVFIHQDGDIRSYKYPEGVNKIRKYMGYWHLLLNRAILSGSTMKKSDIVEESEFFSDLADWLWLPLEISSSIKKVLILPDGKLFNLPWQALIKNNEPLFNLHDIIISPSLRHYLHVDKIQIPKEVEDIKVFVGRTDGLKNINRELRVFNELNSKNVKIYKKSTRSNWPSGQTNNLWHYTGHAELRIDNPFYSSLSLSDGPLFAADFRLKHNKVNLITLAACRTGQQKYLPGQESSGLVRSLLEMGAKNIIASHWAVSDKSSSLWMEQFYKSYLYNTSLEDAYGKATHLVREKFPSAYYWAAFSIFGAGQKNNKIHKISGGNKCINNSQNQSV